MVSGASVEYNITADNSEFKRALDEARRKSDDTFKKTEQSAKRYAKAVRNEMLSVAGAIATVMSVEKMKEYADSWINVENKIKSTGIAFERLKSTQKDLLSLANRTRSGLTETADLYQKIGMNAEKLKLSEKERLRLTETINKGFAISGASGNTKAGAVTQIGQGLGDIFAAQELNSVFDSSMTLTKALLEEFSVDSTKALKELAANGEVTGERVARAWINASKQIDEEFARSRGTISDSLTILENNFTAFIGELDQASGASEFLSGLILALADNLEEVGEVLLITTASMAGFYAPSVLAGIARVVALIRSIGTAGLFARAGLGPIGALLAGITTAVLLYSDAIENLTTKQQHLDDATKKAMSANENFSSVLSNVDDLNKKASSSSGQLSRQYREQARAALQLAKAEATKNAELARTAVTKAKERAKNAQEILEEKQSDFNAMGIDRFGKGGAGLQGDMEKARSSSESATFNVDTAQAELEKAENNLSTVNKRIADAGKLPSIQSGGGAGRVGRSSGSRSSSRLRSTPKATKSLPSQSTSTPPFVADDKSEAEIQKIILDDIKKQEEATKKATEAQKELGKQAGESLARAVLRARDFEGALQNVAMTIAQDLLPELGKMILGGDTNFGGAGLGGAIVSGIGGLFGFGGAKASGGITKAGKAYRVGESGPEMFIPKMDGVIMPNHVMHSISRNNTLPQSSHSNQFSVVMHVQTNDAGSFKKSQAQIAGDLNRQLSSLSRRVM